MLARSWIPEWMRSLGRSLPLLGPLADCTKKNHRDSVKEVAITVLFGTATFWVTAIFLRVLTVNKGEGYFDLLYKTVSSGQLFIFSVGMLGPILLAAADDPDKNKKFPGRASHFSLLILMAALASGFYAFQLIAREPQGQSLLDTAFLFKASLVIAALVLILRYLTTVYRKSTAEFDPEEQMKEPAANFAREFAQMHKEVK